MIDMNVNRRRTSILTCVALVVMIPPPVVEGQNIETELKHVAQNANFAVIPIWYNTSENMQVVGTGFLVTPDGYFVTAAHVLQCYEPKSAQMTLGLRERSGAGSGVWFDVIEKDEAHDLALCKTTLPLKFVESKDNPGSEEPMASLHVSAMQPDAGDFIAIAGFPLGSWFPAIQFGTVAATRTTNPNAGRVPAGQRELLQISASGNKGNSGSPVISLDTSDVIGVIVQAQPAPLFSTTEGIPLAQSSGIMLAVPAKWVQDLLKRHNVTSIAQAPPKGHTSYYPLPNK
jgi:S1-C subfamily serine protease